jgi:DNA replication initiation complex subunit (GINS family)
MLLTFEKIREIQLNERNGELQKLPDGFFKDSLEYLKLKSDTEEGKTAQKILTNLFERRVKKIAALASLYYATDKTPENMDESERELYVSLAAAMKDKAVEFKRVMVNIRTYENRGGDAPLGGCKDALPGSVCIKEPESGAKAEEIKEVREQSVNVRFLKDTPELMTPDMETCSFKEGEFASLPKSFVDFLEKKGFCVIERA